MSPPRAKPDRITVDDKATVAAVLGEFIGSQRVDMIGLCELNQDDIDWLTPFCITQGYLVQSGVIKAGRSKFDTCVIYRADKFRFKGHLGLQFTRLRSTFKVGVHFVFEIIDGAQTIHVFTSHWPSRLRPAAGDRNMLGLQLRSAIDDVLRKDRNSLIVLMGDFNDEPFNESLSEYLMATRDRSLARSEPDLLYNPFWRMLGERDDYHHNCAGSGHAGTHFYGSDSSDRWRTFDQIIVSSAFVGNSDWHLDERSIEVVDFPDYTTQVLDSEKVFDHFPIKIVCEKVTQNG